MLLNIQNVKTAVIQNEKKQTSQVSQKNKNTDQGVKQEETSWQTHERHTTNTSDNNDDDDDDDDEKKTTFQQRDTCTSTVPFLNQYSAARSLGRRLH